MKRRGARTTVLGNIQLPSLLARTLSRLLSGVVLFVGLSGPIYADTCAESGLAHLIHDLQIGSPRWDSVTPELKQAILEATHGTARVGQLAQLGNPKSIRRIARRDLAAVTECEFEVAFTNYIVR